MNTSRLRGCLLAGGFAAFAVLGQAQIVTLRASLNGSQETPANASPATGTAIMLYDVATNTFDLVVSISGFSNLVSDSHLHEAAVGTAGGVVTPIGGESVYTRNGSTLTATFHGITYGGNKLTLLQGGAYYNVHSAQFPTGEIRGQLIAQPKRLVASFTAAQEQVAGNPNPINSSAYGAAVMTYDPVANHVSVRLSLFNFQNTFTNSHFHEAPPGVSGSVAQAIGGPTASGYTSGGGFYSGTFELPYGGDPTKLLTGGAYLNFHSSVYPGGEIRGQVLPDEELPGSRFINLSARGQVGSGSQALIQGFVVLGPEPVRVLITAKGPSLSAFGVAGVLSDPVLSLFDSAGRQIATNNDVGTIAAGSELAALPAAPKNPLESALIVTLPAGAYTVMVSGNNGATGIGLLEVYDLRTFAPTLVE